MKEIVIDGVRYIPAPETKEEPKAVKLEDGFIVDNTGDVIEAGDYYNSEHRQAAYAQGHWFPTHAEAEKESKRRAVVQKMREIAKGFVPDWRNFRQEKYAMTYDYNDRALKRHSYSRVQGHALFGVYFRTKEDLQTCVDALGDEIEEVL